MTGAAMRVTTLARRRQLAARTATAVAPAAPQRVRSPGLRLGLGRGGYEGARNDLRETRTWRPGLGSADADTLPDLPSLRARSRDMLRNAPIAVGALETKLDNVVGTGLQPEPMIDRDALGLSDEQADAWEERAKAVVLAHLKTERCDAAGKMSFGRFQRLAFRARFSDGDCLVLRRYIPRPGDILGLKLQLVEADRVSNPLAAFDDDRLRDGVELDDDGMPVAVHVLDRHPGDLRPAPSPLVSGSFAAAALGARWLRIPTVAPSGERQVLQVVDYVRPEQTRGIPALAPVIIMLKQLGRYTDSELAAAVLTSFFTVFVTSGEEGGPVFGGAQGATDSDIALGQGAIVQLNPGERVVTADPSRPNAQFDPFVIAILRQIGVALSLPFELLIKHFTASYSASRAALLEAWRAFVTAQQWLAEVLCQPTYEWAVAESVARGLLSAPGFFTDPVRRQAWLGCAWHGPTMGQLNPLDEANAIDARIRARVTTRARETAQMGGGSWDSVVRQQAKEQRALERAGLALPIGATAKPAAPDAAGDTPPSTAKQRDQQDQQATEGKDAND